MESNNFKMPIFVEQKEENLLGKTRKKNVKKIQSLTYDFHLIKEIKHLERQNSALKTF